MVIQDDSQPAAPPPQIRILKRPSSNGSLGNAAALARPAVPVKTLAQREAEYAEARRRILGSASSEESTSDKPSPDRSEDCKLKSLLKKSVFSINLTDFKMLYQHRLIHNSSAVVDVYVASRRNYHSVVYKER